MTRAMTSAGSKSRSSQVAPGGGELGRQVGQLEPRLSGGRRECGRGRRTVSAATEHVLHGRPGLELATARVLVEAGPEQPLVCVVAHLLARTDARAAHQGEERGPPRVGSGQAGGPGALAEGVDADRGTDALGQGAGRDERVVGLQPQRYVSPDADARRS